MYCVGCLQGSRALEPAWKCGEDRTLVEAWMALLTVAGFFCFSCRLMLTAPPRISQDQLSHPQERWPFSWRRAHHQGGGGLDCLPVPASYLQHVFVGAPFCAQLRCSEWFCNALMKYSFEKPDSRRFSVNQGLKNTVLFEVLRFSQCKTPQLRCGSSVTALQAELHAEMRTQELRWKGRSGQALRLPRTGWSRMLPPVALESFPISCSCISYKPVCKEKGHAHLGILLRWDLLWWVGAPVLSSLAGPPSTVHSCTALATYHHALW